MSNSLDQHIANKNAILASLVSYIANEFNNLPVGGSIKITKWAHSIAEKQGFDKVFMYQLVSIVLKDFPDIKMKRGKFGGAFKVAPVESVKTEAPAVSEVAVVETVSDVVVVPVDAVDVLVETPQVVEATNASEPVADTVSAEE
jgi:hypothetical protein